MIIRWLFLNALKDLNELILKNNIDSEKTIKKSGGFMELLEEAMEKQEKLITE